MRDIIEIPRNKKIRDCKCPYCKSNLRLVMRDEQHYIGGKDYGWLDGVFDFMSGAGWSGLNAMATIGCNNKNYAECVSCGAEFDIKIKKQQVYNIK